MLNSQAKDIQTNTLQKPINITSLKKMSLLALITLAIHSFACMLPFLYYEEYSIVDNPMIHQANTFWQNFFSWHMIAHKPLTQLSYFIDYQLFGPSAFYFHCNNLLIHLINVILLYLLACKFRIRHAFFAALLFALHPLTTACVSQVHGRAYALATLCMLLALFYYLVCIEKNTFYIKQKLVLIVLFLCMILCKQSFIFFPCLLFWHTWHTSTRSMSKTLPGFLQKPQNLMLVSLFFILFMYLGIFYVLPNLGRAVVSPNQYLWSQWGNVDHFIRIYFFPFQSALVHDLYFYSTLLHGKVLLGGLMIFAWIYLSLRYKHTFLGFFLGAMLLSILPTNSIIPKNEVLREWRLYPSLVFFSLFFAAGLDALPIRTIYFKAFPKLNLRPVYIISMIYLAVFSASIVRQNLIYRDLIATWTQVADMYPYSSDAINNIGVAHAKNKDYFQALPYFEHAIAMDSENYTYELNKAAAYRELGKQKQSALHTQRALHKAKRFHYKQQSINTIDPEQF